MSESSAMPPLLNKTMKFILRSPLHGMVSSYLTLISFTGRKSGNEYTTPVSYYKDGDQVWIFTHAKWWKNLKGGAPVTLRLRGRDFQGTAEPVVSDKEAIAAVLSAHLKQSPFDARFYNVSFDEQGDPRKEEVDQAVETVVMIKVQMN